MNEASTSHRRRPLRCAVYTRKSSEEGLEQAFNSLHAQREETRKPETVCHQWHQCHRWFLIVGYHCVVSTGSSSLSI
jgi:hypothetical protein